MEGLIHLTRLPSYSNARMNKPNGPAQLFLFVIYLFADLLIYNGSILPLRPTLNTEEIPDLDREWRVSVKHVLPW